MRIIWIYRVDADVQSHITTWRETYRHLANEHDIHYIFAYKHVKQTFTDAVTFIETPNVPFIKRLVFVCKAFIALKRLSKQKQPDLIIVDLWTYFFSLMYVLQGRRPKMVLDNRSAEFYGNTDRDTWTNVLLKKYSKLALYWNRRFHEGVTYISEALKRQLEEELRMALAKPYCVWPSGVDAELFDPARYAEREPDETFNLFFHGSMTPNRGLLEVLEALRLLGNRRVHWTLIGGGGTEYLNTFNERVGTLRLAEQVRVIDYLDYTEIPRQIAQADLCVMPYPRLKYWEGNVPIKILEYMAMAKPVLCTDLRVFREITESNPSTVFTSANDASSLAEGIRYAMEHASALKADAVEARRIVQRDYAWQQIAGRLNAYLKAL